VEGCCLGYSQDSELLDHKRKSYTDSFLWHAFTDWQSICNSQQNLINED